MTTETDYLAFRGKCRELSEAAVRQDTSLRLVRGYYHCPLWGKQAHWWTEQADGTVVDPTVRQFPTAGAGASYEEFDGQIECERCGKAVHEDDAYMDDHHAYFSDQCYARDGGSDARSICKKSAKKETSMTACKACSEEFEEDEDVEHVKTAALFCAPTA